MAIGYASLPLGCASDHALGDLSSTNLGIDWGGDALPPPAAADADSAISPVLAAPDVTLAVEWGSALTYYLPTGVGDLNGVGYDDFAINGFDRTTYLEFVHIRYGGPRLRGTEAAFLASQGGARLSLSAHRDGPFLQAMAPLGDIDGDGFADLLAHVARCNVGSEEKVDAAYLLYGGPEQLTGAHRFEDVGVHLKGPTQELLSDPGACGPTNLTAMASTTSC